MNHNTNEEKTENPTEHHIKKFREKGKTKYSRELNSLLVLLVSYISFWWYKNSIFFNLRKIMSDSFCFDQNIINKKNIFLEISFFFKEIFLIFFPFLVFLIVVVTIPPILFSGIALNFRSLSFNLGKLNLFHGLKRIFSFQVIIEFFKISLKLIIISSISFWYLWISFPVLLALFSESPVSALFHGCSIISNCCILVLCGLLPIVVFDVIWQQFTHYKKMKMTYQEIKDELKEQEGNPTIKMRIRQVMKAAVRKRMILDIPKADVIITNPIYYSVALKYDERKMNAPKVVAKGIGAMAIKIQSIAIKHNISIISVPSLARSLYRYAEIGQYIPGSLYKAVAEVLAWVWKMRKWKKEGGTFPEKPKNISVPSELNSRGEHKNND